MEEGDASLEVLVGSHVLHERFAAEVLPAKEADDLNKKKGKDWYKLTDVQESFFFTQGCERVRIKCPKGSMVFWDSRTIHSGVQSTPNNPNTNFRSIVYVCMKPRSEIKPKDLKRKRLSFDKLRTCSHSPEDPRAFPNTPQTYGATLLNVKHLKHSDVHQNKKARKMAGY